jgi:hypothetical protein
VVLAGVGVVFSRAGVVFANSRLNFILSGFFVWFLNAV